MNCIPAVRKALKLEVNEHFTIKDYPGYFFFTTVGLHWERKIDEATSLTARDVLLDLIHDRLEIKKYPWKPKYGEWFYFVSSKMGILQDFWNDLTFDFMAYKIGTALKQKKKQKEIRQKFASC